MGHLATNFNSAGRFALLLALCVLVLFGAYQEGAAMYVDSNTATVVFEDLVTFEDNEAPVS